VLHAAHRVWDVKVQTRVEELSGEPFPSPPPLSLPASFRAA
jgi:hypothetical protein